MKFNKKKFFVTALAVCLIAILSMGSLAWFSHKDSVYNEFFVADSDDNTPDKIFSVDVWEQKDSNGDGDFNEADDVERTDETLTYEDILPGDELSKIAHVTNTGHYDQYIRVIVKISDATAWINAVGLDIDMNTVFVGFDETKWDHISKDINGETDTVTYVLYYTEILESEEDLVLFNAVKVPESLTREQAAAFNGGFAIDVKAQAVQTENVGANAYEAFETVGMAIEA